METYINTTHAHACAVPTYHLPTYARTHVHTYARVCAYAVPTYHLPTYARTHVHTYARVCAYAVPTYHLNFNHNIPYARAYIHTRSHIRTCVCIRSAYLISLYEYTEGIISSHIPLSLSPKPVSLMRALFMNTQHVNSHHNYPPSLSLSPSLSLPPLSRSLSRAASA